MNPVDKTWTAANLQAPQSFFVLLWGELCGGSTLDSWQLRAMNLRSLMEEALDVLDAAKRFPPMARALTDVLAEARAVAQRDPIAKKYYRNVTALLDEPALRADPPDLQRTQQVAEIMLDLLVGYEGFLAVELRELLLVQKAREKSKLAFLASALATELSIRGYSRAYLETLQNEFISVGFVETVAKLFRLIGAPDRKHTCFMPVNWPSFLLGARSGSATVTDSLPVLGTSTAEVEFKALVAQVERFLVIDVDAKDAYAAVAKAQLAAARMLSVAALYAPNKNVELPRQQILVTCGAETNLISADLWHEQYVRDVHDPAAKIARVPADLATTLSASLQYHYLGVLAKAPESRLTNFWIALETLFLESEGSIIERISGTLPASLALDYYRRQAQALSIRVVTHTYRLHEAGETEQALAMRQFFGAKKRRRFTIHIEMLLSTLLDENKATTLFGLCAGDPLLLFRLNKYRDKVMSSSDLAQSIEGHRDVLRWQLRRLYRGRNSLVHRGVLPKRATYLIQNLHTYLVMALNAVVAELAPASKPNLDTAFARRSSLFALYLDKIKSRELSETGLLNPRTVWIPDGQAAIWPNEVPAEVGDAS